MKTTKSILLLSLMALTMTLTGCFGSKAASSA